MSWILTHSGIRLDLLLPTGAMVAPLDIAHSLSHLCRFNGHTRTHYSVAQHSWIVSALVPAEHKLQALLHDATEAYIGDMVRPLKLLMPEFQYVERRVWLAVCERFGISSVLAPEVKHADLVALATERRDLMPANTDKWDCLAGFEPAEWTIEPWTAPEARQRFTDALLHLMQAECRRIHACL